jgi:rSAM-associated Gly-rich repeat protein
MNISSNTGLVGLIITLSTLTGAGSVQAANTQNLSVEARLNRLSGAINQLSQQMPNSADENPFLVSGWANGRGGTWVNTRGGGWGNASGGGGFVNVRPAWRNGWSDGGGFWNSRPNWRNGGSFVNSPWRNGGSFFNR